MSGDRPDDESVALWIADLRRIGLLRMDGRANEEIAPRFACKLRSVERKRALIRNARERGEA